MDKVKIVKGIVVAVFSFLAVKLGVLYIPILVMVGAMAADWITGVMSGNKNEGLSSKKGFAGILKKFGYIFMVGVGAGIDYLISYAISGVGFDAAPIFTMLIVFWLILNELISIMENLVELGVPQPPFLKPILSKLKLAIEEKGATKDSTDQDANEKEAAR